MKIDVIIPTYNRGDLLPRAVESVLHQTYQDFLLTIIDDGSTDHTSWFLKDYKNHPKIRVLSQANSGVSRARNFGIENTSAPWIAFLDSDDEWLPNKLQMQMDYIEKNPQYEFVHTEEIWIRHNIRVNPKLKHRKSPDDLFQRSLEFCIISPSTVLMSRKLFQEYGPFREDFLVCEDFDLWLKILAHEDIGFLNQALTKKYGGHEDQLSTQTRVLDHWRIQSLMSLLKRPTLNEEQQKMILAEIEKKAVILLLGHQKHNKLDHYHKLQNELSLMNIKITF